MLQGETIYAPWPIFTWMRTPIYKQDHQSAGQDGIFYCGRTIWPNDSWWQANYEALGQEAHYYVVKSSRKGVKCADCKRMSAEHIQMDYEQGRGYWELKKRASEPHAQLVTLEALPRVARMMYE